MKASHFIFTLLLLIGLPAAAEETVGKLGYYRDPALHGKTLVFSAEDDLWTVPLKGGLARRLTTHLAVESRPAISPDGNTIAFTASYEGTGEVYTMPVTGGPPTRITFEGYSGFRSPYPVAWKSDTEIAYATRFFARRDPWQVAIADLEKKTCTPLPLEQASDGAFGPKKKVFYFTRLPMQPSHAKRYTGGFIENLWRYKSGSKEAIPMNAGYKGTSRAPMPWKGRLYFTTDEDGTMNLWSMTLDGKDKKQHTHFKGWDVLSPSLHRGRIVFQKGADLWRYDIDKNTAKKIPIRLATDLDQTRERWLEDPLKHIQGYALSGKGKSVALTVRGQVFVVPVKQGRVVRLPQAEGSRYRSAAFLPGKKGEKIYLLSDQTGETEFWTFPADGLGMGSRLTSDAKILRFNWSPSPDGTKIAYSDRNQVLWLLDVATGKSRKIAQSLDTTGFESRDGSWSPDSRWLAFTDYGKNLSRRIFLFDTASKGKKPVPVTTDRLDSYSPAFGAGGKWLYFLSDRTFRTVQRSPWGPRQPEAYLNKTAKVYALDLVGNQRSPFLPEDELTKKPAAPKEEADKDKPSTPKVVIQWDGLPARLHPTPVSAGNYRGLTATKTHLYFTDRPLDFDPKPKLVSFPITNERDRHNVTTITSEIGGYRLSGDRSTVLVRKKKEIFVFPANGKAPANFSKSKVDLSGIKLRVRPESEWQQIFIDAWRMHRDYFYDPHMHRVNWDAARKRHEKLVPRVTTRRELDDLAGQMVGELSAMHTNINPGDVRTGTEGTSMGYLGARLEREEKAGGYRVAHIYRTDPDFPSEFAPLAQPGVDIRKGDIITSIDGAAVLEARDLSELLRGKSGRPVLVEGKRDGTEKPVRSIVKPLSNTGFRNLKLSEWEYTRRLETEKRGEGDIGYFHMRAMGGGNFAEFVKGFYPVFNRKGLIIDMRQNYGGNIDSWILGRLMRKTWMTWKGRTGDTFSNMQYAFNGHMVVLIDPYTISDGEAFSEGFRRLGLGPLIGTQTWGGGIWLRSENVLVDGGIARSPEFGVYSPEGQWIIEGDGIQPDIPVDNLPHQSFKGRDAQLEKAIEYLRQKIKSDPPKTTPAPEYPDKSFEGRPANR